MALLPRFLLHEDGMIRATPEHDLQRAVLKLIRTVTPPMTMVWATPNEGRRTWSEASRLKAQGLRPGVPDLILICPSGFAYFMECKAKGSLTEGQRLFRRDLMASDVRAPRWALVKSLEDAAAALSTWGLMAREARL